MECRNCTCNIIRKQHNKSSMLLTNAGSSSKNCSLLYYFTEIILSSCPLCFWGFPILFLHKLHGVCLQLSQQLPNPLEKWLYCSKVFLHNSVVTKALLHLCKQEALESLFKIESGKKKQNTSLGLSYFHYWTILCLCDIGARLAGAVCLLSVMWQGIPVL